MDESICLCESFKKFFLLWLKSHHIKHTILTVFNCTVQGHQVHSPCYTTLTIIRLLNFLSMHPQPLFNNNNTIFSSRCLVLDKRKSTWALLLVLLDFLSLFLLLGTSSPLFPQSQGGCFKIKRIEEQAIVLLLFPPMYHLLNSCCPDHCRFSLKSGLFT